MSLHLDDSKIQQFVLLAKGARGRALVELISKATAEPGLFGFSELLAVPQIQEIANGDYAPHYAVLELFAYGTWPAYTTAQPGTLPELSPAQINKLKQLTVVDQALASKVIPYAELQKALQISSVRELEDYLITECFYAGILKGKLDQKDGCLQVHDVVGRDVRPDQLPLLEQGMNTWLQAAEGLLTSLEERVQDAVNLSQAARARREAAAANVEEVKRTVKADMDSRGTAAEMMLDDNGMGGGGGDYMEEDRMDRAGGGGGGFFSSMLGGFHGAGDRGDRPSRAARSKKRIQR